MNQSYSYKRSISRWVSFTAGQLALLRNGKSPSQNRRRSRYTDMDIHFAGVLSEIAFGDLIGKIPDVTYRSRGDDGVDFVLDNGWRVDVKSRILPTGSSYPLDLLTMPGNDGPTHYVHSIVPESTVVTGIGDVYVVGYAPATEIEWSDLGRGRCGIIKHDKFMPLSELIAAQRVKN